MTEAYNVYLLTPSVGSSRGQQDGGGRTVSEHTTERRTVWTRLDLVSVVSSFTHDYYFLKIFFQLEKVSVIKLIKYETENTSCIYSAEAPPLPVPPWTLLIKPQTYMYRTYISVDKTSGRE